MPKRGNPWEIVVASVSWPATWARPHCAFVCGKRTAEPTIRSKRWFLSGCYPNPVYCHTFRANGITAYLENGGTIENVQAIANYESPKTTKFYNRTSNQITLDDSAQVII